MYYFEFLDVPWIFIISLYITENITEVYEGSGIGDNDELIDDREVSAMMNNEESDTTNPIEAGIPSLMVEWLILKYYHRLMN